MIGVFGLGNILMRDDAFGPWVIETLRARYVVPESVSVEDLGTPGLDLHPHLFPHRVVILVDTVRAAGPPGTLRRYTKQDILREAPGPRLSPHDPGLKETLLTFELAGSGPSEVVLYGAVPGDVSYASGLTMVVRAAVEEAAQLVAEELTMHGAPVAPRSHPTSVRPWWTTFAA